jgi:hypothetical protein
MRGEGQQFKGHGKGKINRSCIQNMYLHVYYIIQASHEAWQVGWCPVDAPIGLQVVKTGWCAYRVYKQGLGHLGRVQMTGHASQGGTNTYIS